MTELEKLHKLLDEADKLSGQYTGGYSNQFLSAQEFNSELSKSILKLKSGDKDEICKMYVWFAPTSTWDDYIGAEGVELGNEIFELLSELKTSLKIYSIVDLIIDYQLAVEKVMTAFYKKFKRSDLLKAYHSKVIPKVGEIKEFGIKQYAFHGIGIQSTFIDNTTVDFDFAFFPGQKHGGFDAGKLYSFAMDQPNKYSKYLDKQKLEEEFDDLINTGVIVNPITEPATELYFFKSSLNENNTGKSWWKFWK
jgi:hypothetical protein